MIFKLFARKTSCGSCGGGFDELPPVPMVEKNEIKHHLQEAKFLCPKCGRNFHGRCGHVGSASPSGATVTCGECSHTFQQRLPFIILK